MAFDLAGPDSAAQGAVLSEMLATSLGRLAELQVVANSRMVELTPRGTAKFQETVERELMFASFHGKVWMRESKIAEERTEMSLAVGLALGGLEYCHVIPRGCD